MKPGVGTAALMAACLLAGWAARADAVDPRADRDAFRQYFQSRFPGVALDDFANGPYAIDAGMRRQWQDIMQFPPYAFALDDGSAAFGTAFADGGTYAACFPDLRHAAATYPRYDSAIGGVRTLGDALNACRATHGAAPLAPDSDELLALTAYVADRARGTPLAVTVPDDPGARAAYAAGRAAFYAAGPTGASCASCHMQGAGKVPGRATRAPALGMFAAFPVYASGRGAMKSAARQIADCDVALGMPASPADPARARDLEYFVATMSEGIRLAGPGARP